MKFIATLALLAGLAAALPAQEKTAPTWITLRAHTEIRGLVARVGDVAEVKSLDPTLARRVRLLEIGRFENGRDRVDLTQASLRKILTDHGVRRDDLVLRGAERVVVRPQSSTVEPARLRRMIDRHVRLVLEGETIEAIRPAKPLRPVPIPRGRYRSELRIEPDEKNVLYAGRVELTLAVVVDGRVARRVSLPTMVERRGQIVIAKKRVPANRPLRYEDLALREGRLGVETTGAFTSIEEALGQITRSPLVSGQTLRQDLLRRPPVVRRGDIITVRVKIGRLEATALCRAQKDAAPGERFALKNIDTNKTVYAVAVDSRTADLIQN